MKQRVLTCAKGVQGFRVVTDSVVACISALSVLFLSTVSFFTSDEYMNLKSISICRGCNRFLEDFFEFLQDFIGFLEDFIGFLKDLDINLKDFRRISSGFHATLSVIP